MQNRTEKQLEGFLDTPVLFKTEFQSVQQFILPSPPDIQALNPSENIPSLKSNFVLGKRMESFFELLIKHSKNYKILAANTQLFREKVTIGELDFLLKNLKEKSIFHVEMVYKFYLYEDSFEDENQRWIGPNRRDTLLKKIKKLKQRQFPLLFESEAKEFLQQLNLKTDDIKQLSCFKANLFLPNYFVKPDFSNINKDCVAGSWLRFSDFLKSDYEKYEFYCPRKQDWPVAPHYGETWYSYSEILPEIEKSLLRERSPLVWMKKNEHTYERFFVVWW